MTPKGRKKLIAMFVVTLSTDDSDQVVKLLGIRSRVRNQLYVLTIVFYKERRWRIVRELVIVTASSYRSLNTLTEVEEPAGMGDSLGTGAHRHRSILPPGVK